VGRGSRARFCQDGKTWGRRNLNCRDAEAVLADAESLRESDTELDDTAVTALAGQVDRVLEPARGLVGTLTTLRHQLDATTATALSERDAALAEADEHRLQRGRADAEAAQARDIAEEATQQAALAEKEKTAAVRERDQERATRKAAVQEQQRAEGELAAVRDELARVAERAEVSATLAGERATTIATLTAELAATRTSLDEERHRGQAADVRAEAATARAEAAETRAEAVSQKLDAAREESTKARQEAADRAQFDADRLRAGFDQRLAELQASHEQTVRSMHETTTNLGAELRTCTARADAAEHRLSQVRAAVAALKDDERPETLKQLLDQ
jgi:chromosome segregation ATPase